MYRIVIGKEKWTGNTLYIVQEKQGKEWVNKFQTEHEDVAKLYKAAREKIASK